MSVSTADRLLVLARSGGICEVCGQARATNVHHRRPRGMGGTSRAIESPAWLLHVCGQGNTSGCHRRIENNREEARAAGWLLLPQQDAAVTPVRLACGWVVLLDDGDYAAAHTDVSSRDG